MLRPLRVIIRREYVKKVVVKSFELSPLWKKYLSSNKSATAMLLYKSQAETRKLYNVKRFVYGCSITTASISLKVR
jgi:hypothetical protein